MAGPGQPQATRLLHTEDVVQSVGLFELCLVVLFVGDIVLATAVTDGELVTVTVAVTVAVGAEESVGVVVGVEVTVGGLLVVVPRAVVGVTEGAVAVPDPAAEKVRSTQYWLECQLLRGKELLAP